MESQIYEIEIITYYGKTLHIEIDKDDTIADLKDTIFTIEYEKQIPDFNLIYNGKILKNENDKLAKYLIDDKYRFYMTAANVHGGCYKKDNTQSSFGQCMIIKKMLYYMEFTVSLKNQ